jgi:hypothetical protein
MKAWSAPRKWAPMPWKAVNTIRMMPMPRLEAQTSWGANGRGSVLENAHMLNAGADWIPINANM